MVEVKTSTRTPEPVMQLARKRVENFRQTRDEGMDAGTPYTFSDGTQVVIPMAVPNESTRMGNLAFGEARELIAEGNGGSVVQFEDLNGADIEQPASEMLAAGRAAIQRAQDWHAAFVEHKQAVLAIATDDTLTDAEKRNQIRAYDATTQNDGWPT